MSDNRVIGLLLIRECERQNILALDGLEVTCSKVEGNQLILGVLVTEKAAGILERSPAAVFSRVTSDTKVGG